MRKDANCIGPDIQVKSELLNENAQFDLGVHYCSCIEGSIASESPIGLLSPNCFNELQDTPEKECPSCPPSAQG